MVLREDEPADAVFFVVSGVALAVRRGKDGYRELARIGPGQCFGERGVLRGARRSADIIAETLAGSGDDAQLQKLRARVEALAERFPLYADANVATSIGSGA